jgi:hypothetical protein
LCEADEFPSTAVDIDINLLDVGDSAFSLPVAFRVISKGVVPSAGYVSSVYVDMQRVALATVA